MRTLILNFKNYTAVQGEGAVRLARAAQSVSRRTKARIIVAPPTPMLAWVAARVSVQVFSQSISSATGERTTGAIVPESVRAAGAAGTILNHSEARLERSSIGELVPLLKSLRLQTCLCARDSDEVSSLSAFKTEYLAVEPPELIASGSAVSRANPALVERSVRVARDSGYQGKVLCGAGIVDGADVKRAIELGVDGILVSSSVVNATNWTAKISDLARSLV